MTTDLNAELEALAACFSRSFIAKKLKDGDPIFTLREDAPGWMIEAVRECAHAGGDMLPNDWSWMLASIAADCLDETTPPKGIELESLASEWCHEALQVLHSRLEGRSSYKTLADWLGSHASRFGRVEDVIDEYGGFDAIGSLAEVLMRGMAQEADEILLGFSHALVDKVVADRGEGEEE